MIYCFAQRVIFKVFSRFHFTFDEIFGNIGEFVHECLWHSNQCLAVRCQIKQRFDNLFVSINASLHKWSQFMTF